MEVTLNINGLDLHQKLSTYRLTKDISYRKVITTMDDIEHPYPGAQKDVLSFSLLPLTDSESSQLYDALRPLIVTATYTNPYEMVVATKRLRIISSVESTFLLLSVDGKRRYKGGTIELREL